MTRLPAGIEVRNARPDDRDAVVALLQLLQRGGRPLDVRDGAQVQTQKEQEGSYAQPQREGVQVAELAWRRSHGRREHVRF